jgi:hypothetical protein
MATSLERAPSGGKAGIGQMSQGGLDFEITGEKK